MKRIMLAVLLLTPLFVIAQADSGDELVTVPRRYVSSEGLAHQQPQKVSEWIGIGKEIGIATHEGLAAVVDTTERFGSTKVGTFVMVMIGFIGVGDQEQNAEHFRPKFRFVVSVFLFVAGYLIAVWGWWGLRWRNCSGWRELRYGIALLGGCWISVGGLIFGRGIGIF